MDLTFWTVLLQHYYMDHDTKLELVVWLLLCLISTPDLKEQQGRGVMHLSTSAMFGMARQARSLKFIMCHVLNCQGIYDTSGYV